VKKFLQSLGVDGERLNPVGMGSEQPMADNATEEGRLMNRRVEVKLTQRTTSSKKVMSREELKKTRETDGKEHP
jgi:OOP family OmpA-OmpF porin